VTTFKSEAEVYRAIVKAFAPPAYAVLPGVANATGGKRSRVADAIVMSCYPSRGLTLEAVEIKVSRGDWLRELKNPAKQEPIIKYCDRFWLAVGDASIVKHGELPQTWGLLVPGNAGKMKIRTKAPALEPAPMTRGFLAAIMRRANEAVEGAEVRRAIEAEVRAEMDERMAKLRAAAMPTQLQSELKRLREIESMVREFERAAGVRFTKWQETDLSRAAAIVKHTLAAERVMKRAAGDVERATKALAMVKGEIEAMTAGLADIEEDGRA
jgi:hypothetical protein